MSPAKRKKPPALPPAKNYWTEKSIQFAQTANYLDELFRVYPINPELERTLDPEIWNDVKKNFNKRRDKELLRALLQLNLFPIKDFTSLFYATTNPR